MAIRKVIVLYGGESSERKLSLESGKYIFQIIKDLGYDTELIDYPSEFSIDKILENDFIFIALHGDRRRIRRSSKVLATK